MDPLGDLKFDYRLTDRQSMENPSMPVFRLSAIRKNSDAK